MPARLPPAVESRWLGALPPARRARLERLREPADRAASLAGLALLLAAARRAGLPPPVPSRLDWPERGKPCWKDGPDFSIAHGGGHVGCALATPVLRVGLDLEPAGAASWQDLRHALGQDADLPAAGHGDATALWVAKEAVVKAAGATVADLASVRVAGGEATFEAARWHLQRPRLAADLLCAVASDAPALLDPFAEDAAALLAQGP